MDAHCTSKLVRLGKPIADLLPHKQDFVSNNQALLERAKHFASLYAEQPHRLKCMTCSHPIGAVSFRKHGVDYSHCENCGHLNGANEDSDEFCAALYTSDGGESYGRVYNSADSAAYEARVNDIYAPKAAFLIEALEAAGENPSKLSFVEHGAGSGYLMAALADKGIASRGYEVGKSQIDLAKAMRPALELTLHQSSEVYDIAARERAEVHTMVGVLEHLQKPRDMLKALKANPAARYLFLSVPLMSPTVYFELSFPNVMPRHLTCGHTHLYTEQSLNHICSEFDFECVAEWWFGLDMADLYRSLLVSVGPVATELLPAIDQIQKAIDGSVRGSEVHMLWRLK